MGSERSLILTKQASTNTPHGTLFDIRVSKLIGRNVNSAEISRMSNVYNNVSVEHKVGFEHYEIFTNSKGEGFFVKIHEVENSKYFHNARMELINKLTNGFSNLRFDHSVMEKYVVVYGTRNGKENYLVAVPKHYF